MKFIHLSDLHLGKRLHEVSLLEDQRYILTQILSIIDEEQPDGVLIAGDVYDKSVPSAEAVELLDDFLVRLAARDLSVFVISGNHDSPERMAFGGRLMAERRVHLSPVYDGAVQPVTLTDSFGELQVWLLPFVKPTHLRRLFPDQPVESYTDAVALAVQQLPLNPAVRNLLVTHQLVTGAQRCDSEELSIGGSDNVDVAVFAPFDYVALGHIHTPQRAGRDTVRYCGTPLAYSFSEADSAKSVTLVELQQKGSVELRTRPLAPLRNLRRLRGSYAELTLRSYYQDTGYQNDYLQLTLTDEEDIADAAAKLRVIYPNLLELGYDNTRTRTRGEVLEGAAGSNKSPLELFDELYQKQNNQPMSAEQAAFVGGLIEKIWEGAQ